MSAAPSQPALPFPPRPTRAPPFLEGPSNAAALARLEAWRRRLREEGRALGRVAALTGPAGSGKTMLLLRQAEEFGVPARDPDTDFEALLAAEPPALAVDDVQAMAPLDLFALIEASAARRVPLLLAGRGRLSSWAGPPGATLPDLASRLRSIAAVSLDPPDEAMLAQALTADLAGRGLRLPPSAVAEAASRLRREFPAAAGFAQVLEAVAARGYRSSKALLRDALAEAGAFTL